MRGRLQGKVGLAVVGAASAVLLASCLISNKHKNNSYTITLPASLPIYAAGDYISMTYVDQYLVNGAPASPGRGITMLWELASLTAPFPPGTLRTPLRFLFQDASGRAVQYIKQDSNFVWLHAFGGINFQNSFWADADGQLNVSNLPAPVQVFWSPMATADGTVDVRNYAENNKMDFHVMGECDSSTCASLADFVFTEHALKSPGKEVVSTPLGDFETYHLHYSGTMNARAMATTPPHFDYRVNCWTPGTMSDVTFSGDVWIYPPIGAVQIKNDCGSFTNGTYQTIKYTAQISDTNLPF